MRIAILSPAWFSVPPKGYGGIEAVVALLADGLVEAGHEVTLFASGDSRTKAALVSYHEEAPSSEIGTTMADLPHALTCYERASDHDIVNDHSGPLAAAIGCLVRTPVVHTVHGPLTGVGHALPEARGRFHEARSCVAVHEPTPSGTGASVDRQLPERARSGRVSAWRDKERLFALPRPDEPREGRSSGDRGGPRRRAAASAGREVQGAGRTAVLQRAGRALPRRRCRIRRRGVAGREGRAAPAGTRTSFRSSGRSLSAS